MKGALRGDDEGSRGQEGRAWMREGCNLLGCERRVQWGRRGHRGERSLHSNDQSPGLFLCVRGCVGVWGGFHGDKCSSLEAIGQGVSSRCPSVAASRTHTHTHTSIIQSAICQHSVIKVTDLSEGEEIKLEKMKDQANSHIYLHTLFTFSL